MTDQYTVYPEALKKKIGMANKYFEDRAAEEARWAALTPEQQEAEIKEFERIPPDKQEEEAQKLEAAKPSTDLPPVDETVESLKEKLEKVEASLSTLKGKYDAETPEALRENSFLRDQISLLQQQILELKEQKKPVEPPKRISVREALKEHYEALGLDLAPDIIEKEIKKDERLFELAREEARAEISQVATQLDGKLATSSKDRFDKDLIDAYPDWEKMWRTPEFQAFLNEDDGLSGKKKFASIEDAFKRLNSRIVLKAFDLYTGKKPIGDVAKPNLNEDKLKNRLSPPSSSSPGAPSQTKKTNQMTPQEAKSALVSLTSKYARGQYIGSKEQYDKEYAKLHAIATHPQGTG